MRKIAAVTFLVLLIIQVATTRVEFLNSATPLEKDLFLTRLKEYPIISLNLGNKKILLPLPYVIEYKLYTLPARKVLDNFFILLDPNFYFYGSFPRSQNLNYEFEKFPFIFLPFFFYGIFVSIKDKKHSVVLGCGIAALLTTSFIGLNNKLGPFSLLPPFIVLILTGMNKTLGKLINGTS